MDTFLIHVAPSMSRCNHVDIKRGDAISGGASNYTDFSNVNCPWCLTFLVGVGEKARATLLAEEIKRALAAAR